MRNFIKADKRLDKTMRYLSSDIFFLFFCHTNANILKLTNVSETFHSLSGKFCVGETMIRDIIVPEVCDAFNSRRTEVSTFFI